MTGLKTLVAAELVSMKPLQTPSAELGMLNN
jgi:hypothetical protein